MKCAKKIKRNFFSLFRTFTCNNCINNRQDETIVIGRRAIHIYNIIGGCYFEKVRDELLWFDRRLKILLCEFSLYQNNNLLLWIDGKIDFDHYEDFFSSFLDFGYNIHIINT